MNARLKNLFCAIILLVHQMQASVLRAQELSQAQQPVAPILKFEKLPNETEYTKVIPKIEDVNDVQDMPARTVYIEIEPVEDAAYSQIQVRPYDQQWAEPYTFNIKHDTPSIRVRLTPGRYAIRTRSMDQTKTPGVWGRWSDFWIRFKAPDSIYPPHQSEIAPKATITEKITFEWPLVPQSVGYLFMVRDSNGNIIKLTRTKQTWINLELKTNQNYSWGVMPLSDNLEYIGKERAVLMNMFTWNDFKLLKGPEKGKEVRLEVVKEAKALKYEFEILKFLTVNETGAPSYYESYDPNFKITLAPGAYEMRVRMYMDNGGISHWSAPRKFFVQFPLATTTIPQNGVMVDSNDDEESRVNLEWLPMETVERYEVFVYDENGKEVSKSETTDIKTVVKLPHAATYRWQVVAYGPGEPSREPPQIKLESSRFSIDEYIPLLLTSTEESAHFYGWGRYWVSYSNYYGKNYDQNSLIQQPILGGTGELAVGYWHRKTGLGLLLHGSLSGFSLDNSVYNYADLGLDIGKRVIYPDGARLRYWLGINYREFPEFVANSELTGYGYDRVKNYGPQIQVSYMDQFTEKYGWHAYGVGYYGMKNVETPNNLEQIPQFSLIFGLFGTYRVDENMKWMLGYSYKYEAVRYKSSDPSGKDNESNNSGHYLNLSIEMGLTSDKYK